MDCIKAKEYRFRYETTEQVALFLDELNIDTGELVVLIGPTGCGKSTLLRQVAGSCKEVPGIRLRGDESGDLSVSARDFGFVWQDPAAQSVCHRVEEEIVFGMENRGFSVQAMQRRLAEVVTTFGLESLLHKEMDAISAGEQQMVNTAGAVAVRPDLLLLDEPGAALDPVSLERLMSLIRKLHEETGMTILIAEQRPEHLLPIADRILGMRGGKIVFNGDYQTFLKAVLDGGMGQDEGYLPGSVRLMMKNGGRIDEMMTIRLRKKWLAAHPELTEYESPDNRERKPSYGHDKKKMHLKKISFRYERTGKDVLKEAEITLQGGTITALTGGNGSGKTTLARVAAGYLKPYRGRISSDFTNISYLPSDPAYLFLNPVEGSGGEREWTAIQMVLNKDADLYILDEPTKGLDPDHKQRLAGLIQEKCEQGGTVLLVTHDIEFAASVSDRMAMMFDGEVVACAPKQDFIAENIYYTTELRRLLSRV